jgi:hypothetical protein
MFMKMAAIVPLACYNLQYTAQIVTLFINPINTGLDKYPHIASLKEC